MMDLNMIIFSLCNVSPHCSVERADCRLRIKSYKCRVVIVSVISITVSVS